MNNEPVAWMQTFTQVKDGIELVKHAVNIEQVGINDIPLYTHPAKQTYRELHEGFSTVIEATHPVQKPMMVLDGNRVYPAVKELTLTDEEIQEVAHGFGAIGWMGDTTYEFARAILRKAQDK